MSKHLKTAVLSTMSDTENTVSISIYNCLQAKPLPPGIPEPLVPEYFPGIHRSQGCPQLCGK